MTLRKVDIYTSNDFLEELAELLNKNEFSDLWVQKLENKKVRGVIRLEEIFTELSAKCRI